MHKCMVSGCPQEGVNKLGIRCRVWNNNNPTKGKTAALWSPDTDAYLCDVHALSGATITVIYEPDDTQGIKVQVISGQKVSSRNTPIKG
jgi:hypothetical protein